MMPDAAVRCWCIYHCSAAPPARPPARLTSHRPLACRLTPRYSELCRAAQPPLAWRLSAATTCSAGAWREGGRARGGGCRCKWGKVLTERQGAACQAAPPHAAPPCLPAPPCPATHRQQAGQEGRVEGGVVVEPGGRGAVALPQPQPAQPDGGYVHGQSRQRGAVCTNRGRTEGGGCSRAGKEVHL